MEKIRRFLIIAFFLIIVFNIKDKFIYTSTDKVIPLQVSATNDLQVIEENDYTHYIASGDDPYVILYGMKGRIDNICINVADRNSEQKSIQIYYASNGNVFSEATCESGVYSQENGKIICDIPDAEYTGLRIDFEPDLKIVSISASVFSHVNYLCLIIYLLICTLGCVLIWKFSDKAINYVSAKIDSRYEYFVDKGVRCWNVFVVLGILGGLIYSIIIPPFQVPDEQTHITFIEQELGITGVAQQVGQYYGESGLSQLPQHYEIKVDKMSFAAHMQDKFDKNDISWNMQPQLALIRHLPSATGLLIGIFLNLPIYYCLQLAEIFSLLFYVIVGYYALKIVPISRELFMAIMLLPMTLQQCASINYDATVIPLCFLLTAICFDCIWGERRVDWKIVAELLFISLVIALIKIPYILILLLLFLVPKKKWSIKIGRFNIIDIACRYWLVTILSGIVLVILGLYLMRHNMYIKILVACITDFNHFLYIIYRTLTQYRKFYMKSAIGVFGWLDASMSDIFCYGVIIFLFFLAMQKGEDCIRINVRQRCLCFALFVIIMLFLITALLSWNFSLDGYDVYNLSYKQIADGIRKYDVSLGIQGRYFIPILFLLGIPVYGIGKIKKSYMVVIQGGYYLVCLLCCVNTLMLRYWY